MHKWANFVDNGARSMKFGPFDFRGDGEQTGVGLVEISKTFVRQDEIFFDVERFDEVYRCCMYTDRDGR